MESQNAVFQLEEFKMNISLLNFPTTVALMAVKEVLAYWINIQLNSTPMSFFHSSVDEQGKGRIENNNNNKKRLRD